MNKKIYPNPTRPGEYVAFAVLPMNTKQDGQVFMYLAVDAFSKFAFNLGIDRNDHPDSILKHIYLLIEDRQFNLHIDKGFTLVFDRYEEMTDRINNIITGVKGKILIDRTYHNSIMLPVIKSLSDFLTSNKN